VIPLGPYLPASRIADLRARDPGAALEEVCGLLAGSPAVGDPAALERAVLEREAILTTAVGNGIALPHARIDSVKEFVLALGRSREGIDFASLDGKPVHLVLLLAGPDGNQARYLQLLAAATLRLKDEPLRRALREAAGPAAMAALLAKA
jgi:mannitol/fructose-specific phosphotransferase system IIA component (Ntr-type)